MKKKAISIMLVLCMVLSLLPNSAFADEGVLTPNQDLLEAMLSGERQWVIETLVNDKRANNPMAIARHAETESLSGRQLGGVVSL